MYANVVMERTFNNNYRFSITDHNFIITNCKKVTFVFEKAKSLTKLTIIILLNLYCNTHCGESKTQRKGFLDEKRDGLVDENRVNNKENKNNRAVFMLHLFVYYIKPMPK